MTPLSISFVGFGELARAWCRSIETDKVQEVRAYVRRPQQAPVATSPPEASGGPVPARVCTDLADALVGADVVIAAVPGTANVEVARACAPLLGPGSVYVDVSSTSPERKEEAARCLSGTGAEYVDAAVMGTVATHGLQVPVVAAGTAAALWSDWFTPLGARIQVLAGPAGDAARLKLLRSVYMKGRDALVVELLVGATRYGLVADVLNSMVTYSTDETFEAMTGRVLRALDHHAERRSHEMTEAGAVLAQVGIEPLMSTAAAERLRRFQEHRDDLSDWLSSPRPA